MAKVDQGTAIPISPLTKTKEDERAIGPSLRHLTNRLCKYMTQACSAKYECIDLQ